AGPRHPARVGRGPHALVGRELWCGDALAQGPRRGQGELPRQPAARARRLGARGLGAAGAAAAAGGCRAAPADGPGVGPGGTSGPVFCTKTPVKGTFWGSSAMEARGTTVARLTSGRFGGPGCWSGGAGGCTKSGVASGG